MATFLGRVRDHEIILIAWISVSRAVAGHAERKSFQALLDTGAQATMISERVVKEVGLQAIGHMPIVPVTGEAFNARKYRIRLDIPIESTVNLSDGGLGRDQVLRGKDMEVALLPYNPKNYDVLLGMDLLSDFHLSMHGTIFILSN